MASFLREQLASWPKPPDVLEPAFSPAEALSTLPRLVHGTKTSGSTHCTKLCKDLDYRLDRLRFQGSGNNKSEPSFAAPTNDSWLEWLSIFKWWAARFCFITGDYGDFGIGLTTEIEVVEKLGVVVDFVLSNVAGNDVLRNTERAWKLQRGGMTTSFDLSAHKTCICTLFQVPLSTVDWNELRSLRGGRLIVKPTTRVEHLLHLMVARSDARCCSYAILSDGSTSAFINIRPRPITQHYFPKDTFVEIFGPESQLLAYRLAAVLSNVSIGLRDSPRRLLGAMNDPKIVKTLPLDVGHTCFRDFDAYQLARDEDYYRAFLVWKKAASISGFAALPGIGSRLSIARTSVIPDILDPWRCPSYYERLELPEQVIEEISRRVRRPRDSDAHELLASGGELAFEITEVKQNGKGRWSQVYVGRLLRDGSSAGSELCLKLFDDRFFPVPSPRLLDQEDGAHQLFEELHHPDSLLRREEAVYHHLEEHQGQLLPHFYGCHQFTMPDGQKVFGILMENIKGTLLSYMLLFAGRYWDYDEQVKFCRSIRNAVAVLNASHISQRDWHTAQVLCLMRQTDANGEEVYCADAVELVLVDFAFATQPTGTTNLLPQMLDVGALALELKLSDDLRRDAGWNE